MPDKILAAVDIGSSKIATIVGVKSTDSEELRIIGFHTSPSKGVKKGLIVDIDQVTAAVEESIEKTERMVMQIPKASIQDIRHDPGLEKIIDESRDSPKTP